MSLYRKYRPQNLDEVIGQQHVTQTISNALSSDRVSHAYLFSGPRGIGKTSVARLVAKELGCEELDIIEIDAASHRGIDEVRSLRDQVHFQPTSGDKKVYILDEVHMLTNEAFNALLKTIEEPPEHAHFILCTTEPHKVPVTIISRTQRFDFHSGTIDSITGLLQKVAKKENIKIADDAVEQIAEFAQGGYRDALSFLDQITQAGGKKKITKDIVRETLGIVDATLVRRVVDEILAREKESALATLTELAEGSPNWGYVTKLMLEDLRSRLLSQELDNEENAVIQLIRSLIEASRDVRNAPVPQLPIEMAVIEWIQEVQNVEQGMQKGEKEAENVEQGMQKGGKEVEIVEQGVQKEENTDSGKTVQDPSFQFQESSSWWNEVLEKIRPYNHTLEALLRGSNPIVKSDEINLVFRYEFHKRKIEEPQNREIVLKVIQGVVGRDKKVSFSLDRNGAQNPKFHATAKQVMKTVEKIKDPLELALKELGGRLVK